MITNAIIPFRVDPIKKMEHYSLQVNMTIAASQEGMKTKKSSFVEAMKEASACFLLQNLQVADDRSVESWKSDTSIQLDSACTTNDELTFTVEDISQCLEDDGDDDLHTYNLEEALEEALAETDISECKTSSLPSELIVPYPEAAKGKTQPAPWDSSSSTDTTRSSSCTTKVSRSVKKVPHHTYTEDPVIPLISQGDPSSSKNIGNKRESMDCCPSAPRRRRSNDDLEHSYSRPQQTRVGPEFMEENRESKQALTTRDQEFETTSSMATALTDFLLSRLSKDITSKLSLEEWMHVCVEVSQFPDIKDHFVVQEEGVEQEEGCESDDCASVLSELTGFTGCTGFLKKESELEPQPDNRFEAEKETKDLLVSILPLSSRDQQLSKPRRSWHDESKGKSSAPQLPSRRGKFVLDRAISEPRSHSSAFGKVSRTSSLPSGVVSLSRRSVSFDLVEVRHYEQVLCLNPSTTSGPSVGIGWNYTVDPPRKVLEVEQLRDRAGRRTLSQIVIPRHVREESLKDCGYTAKKIAKAVRLNLKARNQRLQTIHNYKLDRIVEKSSRQVRRLFQPTSNRFEI